MSEEIRKKIEDSASEYEWPMASNSKEFDAGIEGFKAGAEFGYQLAQEDLIAYSTWRMKQPRKWHDGISTEAKLWTEEDYLQSYLKQKNEVVNEPSQDELWAEMFKVDEEEGTQEAKKRYRITRL